MLHYEVVILSERGNPALYAEALYANNEDAIRSARRMAKGRAFEVWRELDCVHRAGPEKRSVKPARAFWEFSYPHQVLQNPNMSMEEKRAVLAAWASDVHAVESMPTMRHLPGTPFPVTFSSIMDARLRLDREIERECENIPWLARYARHSRGLEAA
jgi:hypothetical protein